MKWYKKLYTWILRKKIMTLDAYRDNAGRLKSKEISEGYVLYDYNNKPIAIFVCANGVWLTIIPYDEGLDKELGALLGEKFSTRYLSGLTEIYDKFGEDLVERENLLKKANGFKK